jgi:hypothetical protein
VLGSFQESHENRFGFQVGFHFESCRLSFFHARGENQVTQFSLSSRHHENQPSSHC